MSNTFFSAIFHGIIGLSFGGLAAAGVLTVLVAVGLVPRYVGRVHEAKHITLFENMIILGTMSGTLVSFFGGLVSDSGLGSFDRNCLWRLFRNFCGNACTCYCRNVGRISYIL